MRVDHPLPIQIPALRRLWQETFGDTDAFLDGFFDRVFSPDRCRCIFAGEDAAAALYWLDCDYDGGKLAYVYAVATAKANRNQGLCRILMEDTHRLLQSRGYAGAVLVPGEEGLFAMYGKMGYQVMSCMDTLTVTSGAPIVLTSVTPEEYAAARKSLLPTGGVIQEQENLALLTLCAELYAGDGFLLAARKEGDTVMGLELLGDHTKAAGIPAALGAEKGQFRIPGEKPFAMYHPLSGAPEPAYFGLAFD